MRAGRGALSVDLGVAGGQCCRRTSRRSRRTSVLSVVTSSCNCWTSPELTPESVTELFVAPAHEPKKMQINMIRNPTESCANVNWRGSSGGIVATICQAVWAWWISR